MASPGFGQGDLPLGAVVNRSGTNVTGVTFRVWAPNATNAVVRGEFNNWGDLVMTKDNITGYWTATNALARPGQEYKYVLRRAGDNNEHWRHDPRAVWIRNGNSVIYDHAAFDWGAAASPEVPVGRQVMYEMHAGSFYDPNPDDGRPGTLDDAITRLDYLQRLGVNVIALMPVNEFGSSHSWGYNPEHLFAVESAYGGPDALKRFVKAAHQRGMKVQLDVVHNHWYPGADGLWDFDGTNNAYFYPDNPQGWTPWGRRPNYSQPEVRRFIRDNVKTLLDNFLVDGFRWDSPQNILGYDALATATTNTNGVTYTVGNPQTLLPDGKSLMMEINRMIHEQYPDCWSIAEDADLLTVPSAGPLYPSGGFLDLLRVNDEADSFDGHWQTSFHNIITPELAKPDPNVGWIRGKVTEWSEPPGYRVIFTDNHDKSGGLNNNTRLANRMVPGDPTGKIARKKTLINAALTLTAPGTPMLWMGQEFHATGPFDDSVRLNWRQASAQHRIFRAHRDLVQMRELLPALQDSSLDTSAGFIDDEQNLMAYWRLGADNGANVVVLFNLSAEDRDISCPFPTTGTWHVQFNSDWGLYGADFANVGPAANTVIADFAQGSASVRASVPVAAHSVVILARSPAPAARLAEDGDADGLPDGWEALTGVDDPAADEDGDIVSNLREYEMGLDPREADPVTVAGSFNGWNPAGAVMKASPAANFLHYLYVTEAAAPAQEMKFFFAGASYGTSTNAAVASISAPGGNIPYNAPERGYAYFTFDPASKAYTVAGFTPANRIDTDSDGMDDRWEAWHGLVSPTADPDNDTFSNVQEFQRGSHPAVWNRPSLGIAGLNGNWTVNANPLVHFWQNSWRLDLPFRNGTSAQFKFTGINGSTTTWWGDIQPDGVADDNASDQQNININFNQGNGVYRFQFNEASYAYQVAYDTTDANADGVQDAWVAYYNLTGANAAAAADPDGDGINNGAELRRWSSPIALDRMSVVGNRTPLAWSPDDAPLRMTWSDARQRWEWSGTFAAGTVEFKFASGPGWAGSNYGTGVGVPVNTASTAGGANLSTNLPAGRYRFAFSEADGGYSLQSFPVSSEWREIHGLPSGISWANDTDADGVTDLMEYSLGGNPTNSSDGGSLEDMMFTHSGGTDRLVMQWLERTDGGTSLLVTPQISTNVASGWSPLSSSNVAARVGDPANHQRKEVSVPADGPMKFLRLRVSGP